MRNCFLFLSIIGFTLHCNLKVHDSITLSTKKENTAPISKSLNTSFNLSQQWNELKNFMYGNNDIFEPTLKDYQKSQWYLQSIKNIKIMETKLNERKTNIVSWHKENLKETFQVKTAVYLLSGADLFHLLLFYPEAENYIMIAMEDTGELSTSYTEIELQYGLFSTQNIINNLTQSGYLFSKTMRQFLFKNQHSRFSGVLPVFLYFIAYFKYDIIDITPLCLHFVNHTCDFKGIQFRILDNKNHLKMIYYFNKKLEPYDFQNHSILDNFLNSFPKKGLFLKAAVYLFHFQKYLKANEYLIEKFDTIIQDDSGIPYRYIKNGDYNIKLFGKYIDATNIKNTINPFQKDLFIDYQRTNLELPFEFGYTKVRKSNLSNLIYAYK